jgi:ADP-ribose pyrophosphatase YjhB (NUDIX family)
LERPTHPDEVLADAVQRALQKKAGVYGLEPRQLQVFDGLSRDSRGWVLSVAHVCVIPVDRLAGRDPDCTQLVPVDNPGELIYDHREMIELALCDLRLRYKDKPDPDHLLGNLVSLRQLRLLHGAVAGEPIGPERLDTFRRRMQKHLEPTDPEEYDPGDGLGRPALLFQRKADDE